MFAVVFSIDVVTDHEQRSVLEAKKVSSMTTEPLTITIQPLKTFQRPTAHRLIGIVGLEYSLSSWNSIFTESTRE